MKTLAAITLASVVAVACTEMAQADELGVILGCKHINPSREYNEVNPGLYIRSQRLVVGSYLNSFSETATYAAYSWKWSKRMGSGWVSSVTVDAGAIYGYAWYDGHLDQGSVYGRQLLPYLSPSLSLSYKQVSGNLHVMGNAVGLSFSYSY